MRASLIGRLQIGFAVAVAIATSAVGVVASTAGAAIGDTGGADVLHAGWDGGGLSPIGLIIGVVVLILVVKLVFRLIAGPRWYGGPWAWSHGHPGWQGGRRDRSEAFRRWHEQAHAQDGPDQGPREQAAAQPTPPSPYPGQPPQWPPYPAQPPQWPPYPAPPPQWPTYPGQPPQWPDPGQPPAGPRR